MDDGPKTQHGAAGGDARHRAGLGRGQAHADADRRGRGARSHAHRGARSMPGARRRSGLVDAITPRRHFENADPQVPPEPPPPHARPRSRPPSPTGPACARSSRRRRRSRRRGEGAPRPVPRALRDHRDCGATSAATRATSRDDHPASMVSLFNHPTTRNLIRIFKLQDRLKALGKTNSGTDPRDKFGVCPQARPRDRRRRHGRRHRGVVRAARRSR